MILPVEELGLTDGLVQLSYLVQSELARVAEAFGLTLVQTRLLGILRDREAGMLELAGAMGLSKSAATGLVSRAEAHGHVRRSGSEADGRAVRVTVTESGRVLAEAFVAEVAEALVTLSADLDAADRADLARLATAIVRRGQRTA